MDPHLQDILGSVPSTVTTVIIATGRYQPSGVTIDLYSDPSNKCGSGMLKSTFSSASSWRTPLPCLLELRVTTKHQEHLKNNHNNNNNEADGDASLHPKWNAQSGRGVRTRSWD